MIKGCKKFFNRKEIHDFDEFFNAEFINFFFCYFDILFSS